MRTIDKFRPPGIYDQVLNQREIDGLDFSNRYKNSFEGFNCPVCQVAGEFYFEKWGFSHDICHMCGTFYVSPRPSESLLIDYYNNFESPKLWTNLLVNTDSARKSLQYATRVNLILEKVKLNKNPVAIDIGAGSGAFALALKNSAVFKDVVALDISDDCLAVCSSLGITTYKGSIDLLDDDSVDFLSMNDLVEHLHSPFSFIQKCYSVLKSGGWLTIATPNGKGFDFQILNKMTKNVVPPEHINYFNTFSIRKLLQDSGFTDIEVLTPGMLDVQIIQREVEQGFELSQKNEWLSQLFANGDENTILAFQEFLSNNLLSSHMLVLARK